MRISKKILYKQIEFLGKSMDTSTQKIELDISYGGYQLVIVHLDKNQAETGLSRRLTASEMYELLYCLNNLDRRQLLKRLDTTLEYRE